MLLSEYIEKYGVEKTSGMLTCIVEETTGIPKLFTYPVRLSPSGKYCDWGNHPGCTLHSYGQWVPSTELRIIEIIQDFNTHALNRNAF